jgi:hypothetical protein
MGAERYWPTSGKTKALYFEVDHYEGPLGDSVFGRYVYRDGTSRAVRMFTSTLRKSWRRMRAV